MRQVGVAASKMDAEGWEDSVALLRGADLTIATMVHPFLLPGSIDDESLIEPARASMLRTLAAAKDLGARTVYTTTGGRGKLGWDEAAQAFSAALEPCRDYARNAGIELLTEPTPALYADAHIAHTLRDTLALAEIADIGICVDLFSCWTERGLKKVIEEAAPRCHLVQVSDYVLGDRALSCRAVPGDGSIPLEQLLDWILSAGFTGAFDLELLGPRIDKEGHLQAVERAGEVVGKMLARLGA